MTWAIFAGIAAPSLYAQDGADQVLEEIIVTGTRRLDRTVTDS
jgi:hypothetical protein